jgi:hypothetical protein
MNSFFTLALVSLLFSSCFSTRVDYLGNSFTPTRSVDVYVDAAAIRKPYTVIGKGYVNDHAYNITPLERIQENVVEKAKEKGADAVLFQEYLYLSDGSTSTTTARTDSTGRTMVRNTTSGPVINSRREILFLKYE